VPLCRCGESKFRFRVSGFELCSDSELGIQVFLPGGPASAAILRFPRNNTVTISPHSAPSSKSAVFSITRSTSAHYESRPEQGQSLGECIPQCIPQCLGECIPQCFPQCFRELIAQCFSECLGVSYSQCFPQCFTQLLGELMGEFMGELIPQCFTQLMGKLIPQLPGELSEGYLDSFGFRTLSFVRASNFGFRCFASRAVLHPVLP